MCFRHAGWAPTASKSAWNSAIYGGVWAASTKKPCNDKTIGVHK